MSNGWEGPRVADLAQRGGSAVRYMRVGVGQPVEQLIDRPPLTDHAEHPNGLDAQRGVGAIGQIEQRAKRQVANHAERPGRAHTHIAIGVAQQLAPAVPPPARRACPNAKAAWARSNSSPPWRSSISRAIDSGVRSIAFLLHTVGGLHPAPQRARSCLRRLPCEYLADAANARM